MPTPGRRDRSAPRCACRCAFADGFATTARVFTFDGLVDGREHLALGLGDRAAPAAPDGRRPAAGPAAQRVPDRRRASAASAATAARSCARRSSGSPTRGGLPALPAPGGPRASASTPSSTPTCCRTPGSTPTRPTSPSATPPTSATTPSPRRCCARSGVDAGRAAEQQPGQGRPARPARRHRGEPGADRRAPLPGERALPRRQGPPRRAHPRPHLRPAWCGASAAARIVRVNHAAPSPARGVEVPGTPGLPDV